MPKFHFTATDSGGKQRRGMVDAASREMAAAQIRQYGLTPLSLNPDRTRAGRAAPPLRSAGAAGQRKKPLYFGPAGPKKAIALFTRQLAALLKAGMPLLRSLEALAAQQRSPSFKWLIEELADNIRSGNAFSQGLRQFDKEFDRLYVNLVRAGEASGSLDRVLERLAGYMDKTQSMKAKLIAATIYPAVVMAMSLAIVVVLLVFVVPQFEKIFEEQLVGQEMPALTQAVMDASLFVSERWPLLLAALLLAAFGLKLLKATEAGRSATDFLKLRVPKLGDLFSKIYISRFARTLGALLTSGVPVLDALQIARDASGNKLIMDAIDKVRNRVKDGEPMRDPMVATGVFPPMVTSMVEVGEETGGLPEMLDQVANMYDEEIDNAVVGLTSLVEPLMIVLLAGVVITIVLALFLPFVKIIQGFAA